MVKLILKICLAAAWATTFHSCEEPVKDTNKVVKPPVVAEDHYEKGRQVYFEVCETCHHSEGQGEPGKYPPLAKSDFLKDKNAAIDQVIFGRVGKLVVNGKPYNKEMPAQGDKLEDAEIADVLTYVYGSFGNEKQTVTEAEVKTHHTR